MKKLMMLVMCLCVAGAASAATVFTGGDFEVAGNWDNGLPAAGNDGTIAVDGTWISVFQFGNGVVINHTAGDLTEGSSALNGWNLYSSGGIWNMSGGSINGRYINSNGANSFLNQSGGTVTLIDNGTSTGTINFQIVNGGTWNVSGSAILDGTLATGAMNIGVGNEMDFASGWTGSLTYGIYTGTEFRDHFIAGAMTLDGAVIDGATFDSNFDVTGTTLTLVPEPATMALLGLGALVLRRKK